jgi:hypothetical protein
MGRSWKIAKATDFTRLPPSISMGRYGPIRSQLAAGTAGDTLQLPSGFAGSGDIPVVVFKCLVAELMEFRTKPKRRRILTRKS